MSERDSNESDDKETFEEANSKNTPDEDPRESSFDGLETSEDRQEPSESSD